MKQIIPAVKGTRDFYPTEMAVRNWVYHLARQVSESFGYQEYDAPFLETIELYAAKSGEELVKEQSFVLTDRGGDSLALRPELTPSLARMVAQRQGQLVFPLRWWSFGPFWRYERPQKGRTREFFQWNIDLLGANSPEADAELIAVAVGFLQAAGLSAKDAVVLVNSRRLMDAEIAALGIPEEKKADVSALIDRRNKLSPEAWQNYALERGLSLEQFEALVAMLNNTELWKKDPELVRVFAALEAMGVSEYVRFDANIVRGLLYYTGTVFEAFDLSGDVRRAILGGGRYDNLLADVGGERIPGVGFAMGDVVVSLVLEKLGKFPADLGKSSAEVLVTVFDAERQADSLRMAAGLRAAGLKACAYPEAAKLPKQFKYADRMGIRVAIVIGPDEAAAGTAVVKNLAKSEQVSVPQAEAAAAVRAILAG